MASCARASPMGRRRPPMPIRKQRTPMRQTVKRAMTHGSAGRRSLAKFENSVRCKTQQQEVFHRCPASLFLNLCCLCVSVANSKSINTTCCIAGGGPAGMMLGFLLARAGVDVVVLEKHADFLRDFRGDTIHPSTLEVMHELGLLEDFLKRPHQEVRQLGGQVGNDIAMMADFSHLPTKCKYIAFMPQWDFLDFLADHAKRCLTFHLKMEAEVIDLLEAEGRVVGVRANTPDGALDIHADLVVGADGRHSVDSV